MALTAPSSRTISDSGSRTVTTSGSVSGTTGRTTPGTTTNVVTRRSHRAETQPAVVSPTSVPQTTSEQALQTALQTGVGIQSVNIQSQIADQYQRQQLIEKGIDPTGMSSTVMAQTLNRLGGSSATMQFTPDYSQLNIYKSTQAPSGPSMVPTPYAPGELIYSGSQQRQVAPAVNKLSALANAPSTGSQPPIISPRSVQRGEVLPTGQVVQRANVLGFAPGESIRPTFQKQTLTSEERAIGYNPFKDTRKITMPANYVSETKAGFTSQIKQFENMPEYIKKPGISGPAMTTQRIADAGKYVVTKGLPAFGTGIVTGTVGLATIATSLVTHPIKTTKAAAGGVVDIAKNPFKFVGGEITKLGANPFGYVGEAVPYIVVGEAAPKIFGYGLSKVTTRGGEFVAPESVFSADVLKLWKKGETRFVVKGSEGISKDPFAAFNLPSRFKKAIGEKGPGGFTASGEPFKAGEIKQVATRPTDVSGQYIAPSVSAPFLRIGTGAGGEASFSLLPKIPRPFIAYTRTGTVGKIPLSKMNLKTQQRAFESGALKGQTLLSPAFQAGKGEIEAVIAKGGITQAVPSKLYTQLPVKVFGFNLPIKYNIPINKFELINKVDVGKLTKSVSKKATTTDLSDLYKSNINVGSLLLSKVPYSVSPSKIKYSTPPSRISTPSYISTPKSYVSPTKSYISPSKSYVPPSKSYIPPSRPYTPPSRPYIPPSKPYVPSYTTPSRPYTPPYTPPYKPIVPMPSNLREYGYKTKGKATSPYTKYSRSMIARILGTKKAISVFGKGLTTTAGQVSKQKYTSGQVIRL